MNHPPSFLERPPFSSKKRTPHHHHTTTALSRDLEFYAIRLEPEQSLSLYGVIRFKKTLTWRDVLDHKGITIRSCIGCGIPPAKLYRMQPDIKEWIQRGKATAQDCEHMGPWKPNPFTDLGCCIGDLVLYRRMLPPTMLVQCGLNFSILVERYGLSVDIMMLLKYSADDWIALGVPETFLVALPDDQWKRLFGLANRNELVLRSRTATTNGGGTAGGRAPP